MVLITKLGSKDINYLAMDEPMKGKPGMTVVINGCSGWDISSPINFFNWGWGWEQLVGWFLARSGVLITGADLHKRPSLPQSIPDRKIIKGLTPPRINLSCNTRTPLHSVPTTHHCLGAFSVLGMYLESQIYQPQKIQSDFRFIT